MADSSRPLVDVSPETLLFQLSPNKQVGCILYVINSSGMTIAFKVKTTEPRRYLVRPNQGLVAPGKTKQISVFLIEKESNELLRAPALLNSIVDKFLVQTAAVADKDATEITSPTSNPQPEELLRIWQKVAKASIRNKKLAVKMLVSPDAAELLAAGTPGTAAVLSPSRSLAINASTPLSSPGLPEPSPANRGRYSTGTIIRDTRGAPSSGGSFGKGSGGLEVDARVLANKYEDLVNYTANLTEERDELNQALEEAKKALQREMAARIALESKGQMQQGRKQSTMKGTGGIRAGSQYQQRSTGGFSLTTLMVVALVFFLLGHWLDLTSSGHGSTTARPRSPVDTTPVEAATVEAAGIGSSTPLETYE